MDREGPLYTSPIEVGNVQTCIQFNPSDIREVVTTGTQRVVFWSWHAKKVRCTNRAHGLPSRPCPVPALTPVPVLWWPAVQVLLAASVPAGLPAERRCVHHDHVLARDDAGRDGDRGWRRAAVGPELGACGRGEPRTNHELMPPGSAPHVVLACRSGKRRTPRTGPQSRWCAFHTRAASSLWASAASC